MAEQKPITSEKVVYVTKSELPISCPPPDQPLWSEHPRVFIPVAKTGVSVCPYCSTKFILKDKRS